MSRHSGLVAFSRGTLLSAAGAGTVGPARMATLDDWIARKGTP